MIQAFYHKYILDFKKPSGTSRGVLTQKETWFIILEANGKRGIGECGLLKTLSIDDRPDYEEKMKWVCDNIHLGKDQLWDQLIEFPSIQFGIEIAFLSLESSDPYVLFPSKFTTTQDAIVINGLVWMGTKEEMKEQISEKIASGFTCIKMKIGAINFDAELTILKDIRSHFTAKKIEIRVDANGAFSETEALDKINQLALYQIHSIEQPLKQGQSKASTILCTQTPIPIALDEELIGIFEYSEKKKLLEQIKPHYIILKPSLVGGIKGTLQWIEIAEQLNIGWWITSALESNIGLNAIAQWTYTLQNKMPQGLGTGSLYTNNIDSPLTIQNGKLRYDVSKKWAKTTF